MKPDIVSTFDGKAHGVVIAGHFNEPDAYNTRRPDGMDDWLMTYTLGGEGYFYAGGEKKICRAGDGIGRAHV